MGLTMANEEQAHFWNDVAGALWVSSEEEMEHHTGPFGDAALTAAVPIGGERILDVGCGCGATTVTLGKAVGPEGTVVGVDLSSVMLARAEERASASRLDHVMFRQEDAQDGELGNGVFDLVFSRFGVMFFAQPSAAFANLRSALRPEGRLVFVCWQAPSANLWMSLPNRVALRVFDLPPPPHDAPGPFSLANPERIESVLRAGGFDSIQIDPHSRTLELGVGQGVEAWVHQRLLMGVARALYLGEDADAQRRIRHTLIEELAPYRVADGLQMSGAAWVVTAR